MRQRQYRSSGGVAEVGDWQSCPAVKLKVSKPAAELSGSETEGEQTIGTAYLYDCVCVCVCVCMCVCV